MDYKEALEIQIQIDDLDREKRDLVRRDAHSPYPPRLGEIFAQRADNAFGARSVDETVITALSLG